MDLVPVLSRDQRNLIRHNLIFALFSETGDLGYTYETLRTALRKAADALMLVWESTA